MDKKGAELSLTIIIVAILLLVALVVIIVIFSGKTGIFARTTSECRAQGGECKEGSKCPSTDAYVGASCEAGSVCCIPLLASQEENK